MKSSILLAASSAMLAMASPLEKRVLETKVVVDYVTVTVTGNPPASTTTTSTTAHATTTQIVKPAPTTIAKAPEPEPSTTSPTVVIVTVTNPAHQVAPSSSTTSYSAAEEPTSSPYSAVEEPTSTSSSDVVAASPAPAGDDLISNALYHHNIHRSNHSAPAVTWDDTIAGYAAITAKTCVFAHDMTEGGGGYGQNIASWAGTNAQSLGPVGAVKMAATDMWYNGEVNSFLPSYYGEATPDMNTFESWGHMSQLVWKDTQKVGCAVQFCPAGTMFDGLDGYYTVCNYSPPGNVGGAYGTNVLVPQGAPSLSV